MVIIVSTGAKVRSYCSKETSGLHVVLVLRENTVHSREWWNSLKIEILIIMCNKTERATLLLEKMSCLAPTMLQSLSKEEEFYRDSRKQSSFKPRI